MHLAPGPCSVLGRQPPIPASTRVSSGKEIAILRGLPEESLLGPLRFVFVRFADGSREGMALEGDDFQDRLEVSQIARWVFRAVGEFPLVEGISKTVLPPHRTRPAWTAA